MCGGPATLSGDYDVSPKAEDNFNRWKNIKDYYSNVADIYEFKQAFPDVNYRYYVYPTAHLGSSLDFNNGTTWEMQTQGRYDGG